MSGTDSMQKNDRSLLHFFWIYFGSVALLIISAAVIYFFEREAVSLSAEHDSILQYAKMQQYTGNSYKDPLFTFSVKSEYRPWYETDMMRRVGDSFIYEAPTQRPHEFLLIKKSALGHDAQRRTLMISIIIVVAILLGLFSVISWMLARQAISPLETMISDLDDFLKDLVHDLNTPATSILLNAKLLRTKSGSNDSKRIERIESSTKTILSLYENLSILLNEHKRTSQRQDIVEIIKQVTEKFKELYPATTFKFDLPDESIHRIDRQAFEQLLSNLLANACKYGHRSDPIINIRADRHHLEIEDNGIGMEHPEKVFDRHYSEHTHGHGIGMHIVHRLSQSMGIAISFESQKDVGTKVTLRFTH